MAENHDNEGHRHGDSEAILAGVAQDCEWSAPKKEFASGDGQLDYAQNRRGQAMAGSESANRCAHYLDLRIVVQPHRGVTSGDDLAPSHPPRHLDPPVHDLKAKMGAFTNGRSHVAGSSLTPRPAPRIEAEPMVTSF